MHDVGMVSGACPTVGGPFLSSPRFSHLRSQPSGQEKAQTLCGGFSVSRADSHPPLLMLTSAQGQWWHSEKCAVSRVSVQESGKLEKMEGPYCHSQIPLSIPKLCGTGLGACNKVGSPQCLPRQTSKSSDLQAVCEAAVSMCH